MRIADFLLGTAVGMVAGTILFASALLHPRGLYIVGKANDIKAYCEQSGVMEHPIESDFINGREYKAETKQPQETQR